MLLSIKHAFMNLNEKSKMGLLTIISALLICLIVYSPFIFGDKLYIFNDVGSDTFDSYWPIYKYLTNMLQNFDFRQWNHSFGIGNDIYTFASFLFDPFILILCFFNEFNLVYGLLFISILKITCIAFFMYLFLCERNVDCKVAFLGSLLFAFSSYVIIWGQHYQFLTYMFYFSVNIYMLQRWLNNKKSIGMILSVCMLMVFSLYFSFTYFLFSIFYVAIHSYSRKGIRESIEISARYVVRIGIATLLGGIFIVPQMVLLLGSSRVKTLQLPSDMLWFSSLQYITIIYKQLSPFILGINKYSGWGNFYESPQLFISLLAIFALPQMLVVYIRTRQKLKLCLIGLYFLLLTTPIFTLIFNKFSAFNFRWTYISIFLTLILLIDFLELLRSRRINNSLLYTTLLTSFFFLIEFRAYAYSKTTLIFVIAYLIVYYLLIRLNTYKQQRVFRIIFIAVILCEISINSFISVNYRVVLNKSYITENNGYFDGTAKIVKNIEDDRLYRVQKNFSSRYLNDALFQGYPGTEAYNSLNNSSYIEMAKFFNFSVANEGNSVGGFFEDDSISSILSARYCVIKGDEIPYGAALVAEEGNLKLYEKKYIKNSLFYYDNYTDIASLHDKIDRTRRDQISFSALVEKSTEVEILKKNNFRNKKTNDNEIDIDTVVENYLLESPKSIRVNRTDYEINDFNINIKKIYDNYITISFTLEDYDGKYLLYNVKNKDKDISDLNTKIIYLEPNNNKLSFDINYKNIESVSFILNNDTTCVIKNLKIAKKPYNKLVENIEKLNSGILKENLNKDGSLEYRTNTADGIMVASVPYDKYWKVLVDGEVVDTFNANGGLLGFYVTKGMHQIIINHKNEYGVLSAGASIIGLIIIVYLRRSAKKL